MGVMPGLLIRLEEIAITSIAHQRYRRKSFRSLPAQQIDAGTNHKAAHHAASSASCQEEVGLTGDYLSDNLSAANRKAFESHLRLCPDCAAFLQTYKKTIEITRSFLRLDSMPTQPRKLTLPRPPIQPGQR